MSERIGSALCTGLSICVIFSFVALVLTVAVRVLEVCKLLATDCDDALSSDILFSDKEKKP